MTTLNNEITINAPVDKIWEALSNIENLDKYDPTVKKVNVLSESTHGLGAKRRVEMNDGKNWFEETCTVWQPNQALKYELSDCSFPMSNLNHSYSFEKIGQQTKVKQRMEYQVKYGLLGKILDTIMIKKSSDSGIKKFFQGLKAYSETNQ
jgi:ribosome-associated toxin RatA of RatAB toxin-antitoxin module